MYHGNKIMYNMNKKLKHSGEAQLVPYDRIAIPAVYVKYIGKHTHDCNI